MKRILMMAFIFILTACTPQVEPIVVTRVAEATAVPPTPPSIPQLDGTEWELVLINGRPPIPNSRTTLAFSDGNAGGYTGCNNYGGAYTATSDGDITMPEMAMNQALCHEPEGIMDQESAFMEALWQATSYTFSSEQLQIVTADGITTLTFAPIEQYAMNPVDLIGTGWQLVSWGERELPDNHGITLIFDSNETMSGFAGCRHYEGGYFATNDDIRFPSLGMVEVTCDVSEEMLILEGDFTTALSESTQYHLQAGQLELFTNPGETLLFVPLVEEEAVATATTPVTFAAPPADLPGHTWQLVAAGDEASDMFLPDPPAWLRFTITPDPNGSTGFNFEGFSGCNSLFGSYFITDEGILVMDVGQTEQDCGDELMAFEQLMVDTLHSNPMMTLVDDSTGEFLILQSVDDAAARLVFGIEKTAVSVTPTPALYGTAPAPSTEIAPPAGLIVRDSGGAYWQIDAGGTAQQLALPPVNFASFNSSHTLAAYAAQVEDGALGNELTVVNLQEGTAVTHQLNILSLADLHSLQWLNDTTLVLGVFDDEDDFGPNSGHLSLLDAATGELMIVDNANKMTTPPAVANGRILYSIIAPDPILYQWQAGTLSPISSDSFMAQGITTGDTSLFSPALSANGKQAWWGKFPIKDGTTLFIYDPVAETMLQTVAIVGPPMGGFPYAASFNDAGTWVAFPAWAREEAQAGVYLVNTDSGWTLHVGTNTSQPLWLDNDRVAYVSQGDAGSTIQVFSVANGQTATMMVEGVTAAFPVHMAAP